jgi:hypothetical protein
MVQLYKTIFIPVFISFIFIQTIFAQKIETVQDSTQLDSTAIVAKENNSGLTNESFYSFNKLVNTTFDGFSDVMRTNANLQVFDFMDLGQPRFIAPLNMFPHQAASFVDGLERNEYTNGMFNTRFISLDHTDSLRNLNSAGSYKDGSTKPKAFYAQRRRVQKEDAYTRLKFYEGDFSYTDLDIYFARKYSDKVRIGLSGFNKGYGGTSDTSGALNNSHTSVAYNAYLIYQINKSTQSEFTWRLNRERSGVHKRGQTSNFSYSASGSTYGLRFIFDADTLSDDKVVLGFLSNNSRHENRSGIDSFSVKQHSDDYKIYLTKNFSTVNNKFSAAFSVDNHRIWGNAFANGFSETRFSLNLNDKFIVNEKTWLNAGFDVEQLNNFNPNINASLSPGILYSDFFSGLNILYSNRYPNPVERVFSYRTYSGNKNLNSETFFDFSFTQKWQPQSNLFFESRVGYNQISDEIVFTGNNFKNGSNRSWGYLSGQAGYDFWKIKLSTGGHLLAADQTVSAKQTFWGQVAYHGNWFNTFLIDATASMNWYSRHDAVNYNPIVNRFFSAPGENDSYMIFSLKIVVTVSDAEFFLEMDNPFKTKLQYIEGYFNELQTVRAGVNWVLWD